MSLNNSFIAIDNLLVTMKLSFLLAKRPTGAQS